MRYIITLLILFVICSAAGFADTRYDQYEKTLRQYENLLKSDEEISIIDIRKLTKLMSNLEEEERFKSLYLRAQYILILYDEHNNMINRVLNEKELQRIADEYEDNYQGQVTGQVLNTTGLVTFITASVLSIGAFAYCELKSNEYHNAYLNAGTTTEAAGHWQNATFYKTASLISAGVGGFCLIVTIPVVLGRE